MINDYPEFVQFRLKKVYTFFGISLCLTSVSALISFHIPPVRNFVARQDSMAIALNLILTIGSGILTHAASYQEKMGIKHLFWLLHVIIMGASLSPVCVLEKVYFLRIIFYTLSLIALLLTAAFVTPSDTFSSLEKPLTAGSDIVFCASVGRIFLSTTSFLGSCICLFSVYGSLLLFVVYLLYDSQKIILNAESHREELNGNKPYDPINAALTIYTDSLNIFIRVASFVTGSECGRKAENNLDVNIQRNVLFDF